MTETPATTPLKQPIFPPGRYGRRREPRRTPRLVIALAAAAMAVAGTFIGITLFNAYGEGDYSATVTAFAGITDTQVVVTFTVRLPADGVAKCVVRARDVTGAEAGREEISVKAGPVPDKTVVTHRLQTRTRPVTGEVRGCRPA
ncbi:MAG TPA: DUF4307 domain-containing protein [Candidatus Limnocylindrales bacterium]